jgi:hypothetical protein
MWKSLAQSKTDSVIFTILTAITVFTAGCGADAITATADEVGSASLKIGVAQATAAGLVRVEVVVTGDDMAEIRQDLALQDTTATGIVSVPVGVNRKFTLNGYDVVDNLLYTGSSYADVLGGSPIQINIVMRPKLQAFVVSIRSPIFVLYDELSSAGAMTVSGLYENPSSQNATNITVQLTAFNAAQAPMAQFSTTLDSIPPGTLFFSYRFADEVFSKFSNPARTMEYRIAHSLGGPDAGLVDVSGE